MLIPLKAFHSNNGASLKIYKSKTGNVPFVVHEAEHWPTPSIELKEDTLTVYKVEGATIYKLWINGEQSTELTPHFTEDKVIYSLANVTDPYTRNIQVSVSDNMIQKADSKKSNIVTWPIPTFGDNSWYTIKKVLTCTPTTGGTYVRWSGADGLTKSIQLTNGNEYLIRLCDRTPDRYPVTGRAIRSCAVFEFTTPVAEKSMKDGKTNANGWLNNKVNTWLNTEFINLLPNDLLSCIAEVDVKSSVGGQPFLSHPEIKSSSCKLFLPAGIEILEYNATLIKFLSGESDLDTNTTEQNNLAEFTYYRQHIITDQTWTRSPFYHSSSTYKQQCNENFILQAEPEKAALKWTYKSAAGNTAHGVRPIFAMANI